MYIMWLFLAFLIFYLIRAVTCSVLWDKFLNLNLFSNKIILMIVVYAWITETNYFLDFAIVYILLGFIGIIFTALFFLNKNKIQNERSES